MSSPIITLTFRNRGVAVYREECHNIGAVIALARATFPTLQRTPNGGLVVLATLPQDPGAGDVEVSDRVWALIQRYVDRVRISLVAERLQLEGA